MKYIFANFKMNMGVRQTESYVNEFLPKIKNCKHKIVLFPSFINLGHIKQDLLDCGVEIGAQNIAHEENGFLTGEISAIMLKELKVSYVLIGHSSRRQYLKEGNAFLNKKILNSLAHDIKIVLCIGETQEDKANNKFKAKIKAQITQCLKNIKQSDAKNVFVAYEPVWAIGSSEEISLSMVEENLSYIKQCLHKANLDDVKIVYGGNVNIENSSSLLKLKHIDGLLVGRACLNANEFAKICLN